MLRWPSLICQVELGAKPLHPAVVILLVCLHVGAAAGHRVVDEQNDECADYGDQNAVKARRPQKTIDT
jgi:hypothetical protein